MIEQRQAVALLVLITATAGFAQDAPRPAEAMTRWQWLREVALPDSPKSGPFEFRLDAAVLDAARSDLADLRLFDANGREVPYAARVRLPRDEVRDFKLREFNRATHPDRTVEVSVDSGDAGVEHNRIEVSTGGGNYRRLLRLEGSDDGKTWKPILDKRALTYFTREAQVFDGRQIGYTASRYRYLRATVSPDPAIENDAPEPPRVRVLHSVQISALEQSWPAVLSTRTPVRDGSGGEYASEWFIGLPGRELTPWRRLEFDADEAEFARTYRLEDAEERDGYRQTHASGEWRRTRTRRETLTLQFTPEITARQLRLVIVDQRNPPLNVRLVNATAAVRQVIFERPAATPLTLYFGNPEAPAPGYDYARTLPDRLDPEPATAQPGHVLRNPNYEPPRVPFTERSPLLTYIVFGIVGGALLVILGLLARSAIAAHDAAAPPEPG